MQTPIVQFIQENLKAYNLSSKDLLATDIIIRLSYNDIEKIGTTNLKKRLELIFGCKFTVFDPNYLKKYPNIFMVVKSGSYILKGTLNPEIKIHREKIRIQFNTIDQYAKLRSDSRAKIINDMLNPESNEEHL